MRFFGTAVTLMYTLQIIPVSRSPSPFLGLGVLGAVPWAPLVLVAGFRWGWWFWFVRRFLRSWPLRVICHGLLLEEFVASKFC